jgi:hypothetical protein
LLPGDAPAGPGRRLSPPECRLKATLAVLKTKGVRQRAEMLEFPHRKLVFLEGPEGITIELSEWR